MVVFIPLASPVIALVLFKFGGFLALSERFLLVIEGPG